MLLFDPVCYHNFAFLIGCGTQYRGDQVAGVCASGGMKPVSLDDPALASELVS